MPHHLAPVCVPHHLVPSKNGMPCTELCACELGDKVSCENQSEGHLMSDDESDLDGSEEEKEHV